MIVISFHIELALDSASPSTGSFLGGTVVTLTGKQFLEDMLVEVDGVELDAHHVEYVDESTLEITMPAGTLGSVVDIKVIQREGSVEKTLTDAFTYAAFDPFAAEYEPASAYVAPDYAKLLGVGTWTATVGEDLIQATRAPYELGGAPDFDTGDNGFSGTVPAATWLGSLDESHQLIVLDLSQVAADSSFALWQDASLNIGLILYTYDFGGGYYVQFIQQPVAPGAFSYAFGYPIPANTRVVIQTRKTAGRVWVKINDAEWQVGLACGTLDDSEEDTTLRLAQPTPAFYPNSLSGPVLAFASYGKALDNVFADNVVTWAAATFPETFDPLATEHGAVVAYRGPEYSKTGATGTWLATKGTDLTQTVDAPAALAGAPVCIAGTKALTNATPVEVWAGATEWSWICVVDITTPISSSAAASAMWDNQAAWCDTGGNVGLHFYTAAGLFYAAHYGYLGPTPGAKNAIAQLPASTGRYVIQGKREDGQLWIKVDAGDWQPSAVGTVAASSEPIAVGTNYAQTEALGGTVLSLAIYPDTKSDEFADAVPAWAAAEFAAA